VHNHGSPHVHARVKVDTGYQKAKILARSGVLKMFIAAQLWLRFSELRLCERYVYGSLIGVHTLREKCAQESCTPQIE
jgi:hypothetical protein